MSNSKNARLNLFEAAKETFCCQNKSKEYLLPMAEMAEDPETKSPQIYNMEPEAMTGTQARCKSPFPVLN